MSEAFARSAHPWLSQGVRPFTVSRDDGLAYWMVDILWIMLATGEDTGGQYSIMEELCPKGSGPGPHYHDQDEAFYVIEGELTLIADGKPIVAKAGSFVAVPRDTVHSFRIDSETCRLLNLYSPAGFEVIVKEGSLPAERREIPPPGTHKAMAPNELAALVERVGMHIVDEPDVLRTSTTGETGRR